LVNEFEQLDGDQLWKEAKLSYENKNIF
jgi:hypothetical protein